MLLISGMTAFNVPFAFSQAVVGGNKALKSISATTNVNGAVVKIDGVTEIVVKLPLTANGPPNTSTIDVDVTVNVNGKDNWKLTALKANAPVNPIAPVIPNSTKVTVPYGGENSLSWSAERLKPKQPPGGQENEYAKGDIKIKALLLVEIIEVAEKDQLWNKAHSPKEPGYNDDAKEGSDVLWNTVFVAVEPSSSKIELVVTTTAKGTSSIPLLVGVMDKNNMILRDVATVGANGKAELTFTPAHSINDGAHKICLGYDKNRKGDLSKDEIVMNNLPANKTFQVRAVTQADYDSEMLYLHWYIQSYRLVLPVATSFVRYFDAADTTLMQSSHSATITIPITRKDLTHIAGSPYSKKLGNTVVPQFTLPVGSNASKKIGNTFNTSGSKGMSGVVRETWAKSENAATLKAPFESDPTLQTWTSPPITISVTGGSINLDGAGSEDLTFAFGTAGITGTLKFKLKRDKTDPKKVLIDELDADCVVEDLYDFD